MCKKVLCLMTLVLVLGLASNASANLVSRWKMDEASWNGTAGEVIDSVIGNHGTASGNATTAAPGAPYGNGPMAGTFDGNGDNVAVPDDPSITFVNKQDFSIAFWINANELVGNFQDLVSKSGSASYRIMMAWDNKIKLSLMQPGFTAYSSGYVPTLNTWDHITMAVDFTALQVRWYLNGNSTPIATNTLANANMGDDHSSDGGQLAIADQSTAGNERPFDGLLDDVRIYNHAVTDAEVPGIVPEPATVALLGLGGLALLRRKK